MADSYQICTQCVMDRSYPDIRFDEEGVCHYCRGLKERLRNETIDGNHLMDLQQLVQKIKRAGRGRDYDCIIGVSGGVDSTYVAWLVRNQGLKPLAVHFDNGWNSELAVANITRTLEKLQIDLHTHVVDWEEFRDLQRAFFLAGVVNIEIATDHGINALLQQAAVAHGCRYIINGSNIRSEGISPPSWGWYNIDLRHLRAIHRQFGTQRLRTMPQLGLARFGWNTMVRGIRVVPILNYMNYSKTEAITMLERELQWRPYGGKHYESVFTRFFQGYILPRKFNVDKRRGHYSTLVVSGDMTRNEALAALQTPTYDPRMQESDLEYFLKKMEWAQVDFETWLDTPPKRHTDYPTHSWFFEGMPALHGLARRIAKRR